MEATEIISTEYPTTEESTVEVITEAPTTKTDQIKEGVWISYSPQALMFDAYQFGDDGILEKTAYVFETGSVEKYSGNDSHAFLTYRVRGNQILITDKKSIERTWYFTDDADTLEFANQDVMGGDRDNAITVSQKIRRHQSLPDYSTAKNERKE